jgi:glycosyltransferase involved in cell wall biosynthesis
MFYRQARSLADAGCEVVFICQHSAAELIDEIRIVPLPPPHNRFDRMTRLGWRALILALRERASVYHLHSPELLLMGAILRLLGKKVIYDAHEAFGQKVLSKAWIPVRLRGVVSGVASRLERLAVRWCSAVFAADRVVARQFPVGAATVVANYPVLATLASARRKRAAMPRRVGPTIAYIGGLTKERGLDRMLEAVERYPNPNIRLLLLGRFRNSADKERVLGCGRAIYLGMLRLDEALAHVMGADAGLALFEPTPGFFHAGENTNKLFEYMGCGVPVVASRFPNLQRFVEGHACGLCVDPLSTGEVVSALGRLLEEPGLGRRMGENGRRQVHELYNWERESSKLFEVYRKLLSPAETPRSEGKEIESHGCISGYPLSQ